MLNCTGVDLGKTGTREVSIGLLWGGPKAGDGGFRRRASVPSDLLTFRRLVLPPANREVRRRVVQEELNFSLPFPLSQAAWDWTDDQGEAWVVVAPRDRLESIRRAAGDSADLDAEPLSYLRAAQAAGIESALIIDFGASRTTFCAVDNGRVDWVRVLLRGGIAITRQLAHDRSLTLEKAETLKRSRGMDLESCAQFVAESLNEAFLPDPLPYDQVLICGGGAALPGLGQALTARLGLAVRLFPIPEPLSAYEHVAAYGAALGSRPRYPRVCLRSHETQEEKVRFRWRSVAWVFVLVALIVADVEIRHRTLQERVASLQGVVTQAMDPVLGPSSEPIPARVEELRERIQFDKLVRSYASDSVMRVLAGLAGPLRDNPGVQLRAVEIEDRTVSIEGHARSPQQVEQVRQALDGEVFEELKAVNVKPGSEDRFLYELEGRMLE